MGGSNAEKLGRYESLSAYGERQKRSLEFANAGQKMGSTQFFDQIQKGLFSNDTQKDIAKNTAVAANEMKLTREAVEKLKMGMSN